MTNLVISLGQMKIHAGQLEENRASAQDWAREARRRGSDILILPELWLSGYDLANAERAALLPPYTEISTLAREANLSIIGSVVTKKDGRLYNTALIFAADGELLGEYDKIHLFGGLGEDEVLTPGQNMPVFDFAWGRGAVAICYDLRFPELFRHYALVGAQIIFVPAQWPHARRAHWTALLRARAIENQCFIVACNAVGNIGEVILGGRSAIYSPWGETIIEAGATAQLLTVEIALEEVEAVREKLPVFSDRRADLYG